MHASCHDVAIRHPMQILASSYLSEWTGAGMLFTPAYIFTILLGIWMLSLAGCIVLGILCYRLILERRQLRGRLDQMAMLHAVAQSSTRNASSLSPDSERPRVSGDAVPDGGTTPPERK